MIYNDLTKLNELSLKYNALNNPFVQVVVGNIKTPVKYIEQKQGIDYVAYNYMRFIAELFYPGFSWEQNIVNIHKSSETNQEFVLVSGTLHWSQAIPEQNGVKAPLFKRTGSMSAAHRIMVSDKKDGSKSLTEPNNDTKAANTDCMRKAFNMYFHVANDVYRQEDPLIDKEDYERLKNIKPEDVMDNKLEMVNNRIFKPLSEELSFEINKENIQELIGKINNKDQFKWLK